MRVASLASQRAVRWPQWGLARGGSVGMLVSEALRVTGMRFRLELVALAAPVGELFELGHDLLGPFLVEEVLDGLAVAHALHPAALDEEVPLKGLHEEREARVLVGVDAEGDVRVGGAGLPGRSGFSGRSDS